MNLENILDTQKQINENLRNLLFTLRPLVDHIAGSYPEPESKETISPAPNGLIEHIQREQALTLPILEEIHQNHNRLTRATYTQEVLPVKGYN